MWTVIETFNHFSDVEVVVGGGFPPVNQFRGELLLRAGEEDLGALADDPVLTVEMPRIAELLNSRGRAHDERTYLNLTLEPLLVRLREPQLLAAVAVDLRSLGVHLSRVLLLLLQLLLQLGDPLPQGADVGGIHHHADGDEEGDEEGDDDDCDVHCQLSCATEWQHVAPTLDVEGDKGGNGSC